METSCVIVIGASAGGVEAVQCLLAAFPPNLPAAVLIVVHTSARGPGLLGEIFNRVAKMPVAEARDGERVLPGRVYVAKPNQKESKILAGPGPRSVRSLQSAL